MKKSIVILFLILTVVTISLINSCKSSKVLTFEEFARSKSKDTAFLNKLFPKGKIKTEKLNTFEGDYSLEIEPPKYPFKQFYTQLPQNDTAAKYVSELNEFVNFRLQAKNLHLEYQQYLFENKKKAVDTETEYLGNKAAAWNKEIFWIPASKTNDVINNFGDEVRSVFGKIPDFDVTKLGKFTNADGSTTETVNLGLQVDGNWVKLKPNTSKPGSPLEFEIRDIEGNFVNWASNIEKCDKPSLAGGVTPCGTSSRLSVIKKGSIEWIALARKTHREEILKPEKYWLESDLSYELLGYIGFNRNTGEVCFFDGAYNGQKFSYDKVVTAPGGNSYSDDQGRTVASSMYDPIHRIDCAGCHDNKEPRIVTPYIKQARVGFSDDRRAISFGVGEILPNFPGKDSKPYRVVGTNYNTIHTSTIIQGKTVKDPNGNCTSCHSLTNLGTATFALDAIGKYDGVIKFRTDWASRQGLGKIHPWMVPEEGNVLEGNPPPREITDAEWKALEKLLNDPSLDPNSKRLYNAAPAPESTINDDTRIGDPSTINNLSALVKINRDGDNSSFPNELQISWNYLNSLGGVLTRDDIRFNIAIAETEIKPTNPSNQEYPTIDQTIGSQAEQINNAIYKLNNIIIFKDASFENHLKFTEPTPSTTPRNYVINLPAKSKKRYLITVLAKRYTFDNDKVKYSNITHTFFIDTK